MYHALTVVKEYESGGEMAVSTILTGMGNPS